MPEQRADNTNQSDLSGRSVFVTGGTGFVGSHFVERLLDLGCTDIRCLVRNEPRFLRDLPVTQIHGDLFDREALVAGIRGVDFVVHIAAVTRARSWPEFSRSNVDGTVELLNSIVSEDHSIRKVVVTSSLAAVGRCGQSVADETSPLHPVSRYGKSKRDMEAAVSSFQDKMPIVIVRPPAVYGPRESDIYTFFKTIRSGLCPIIGTGKNPAVSLVFVDDLVNGMIGAMQSERTAGEIYFLGSNEQYSWREIRDASATALQRNVLTIPIPPFLVGPIGTTAELIGKLTGTYPPLNREKAAEIRYACTMCNSSKARQHFGYVPETDLWNGIQKTIRWYRNAGWL